MTPKNYSDVVDEWISWQRQTNKPMPLAEYAKFMDLREGGPWRQSAYDPNAVQEVTDYAQRAFAGNAGTITNMAGARTGYRREDMPKFTQPTGNEIRPGDVTGEMGATMGSLADLVAPDGSFVNTMAGRTGGPATKYVPREEGQTFEDIGRLVGTSLPDMVTTAPLLMAGPAGLGAAALKTGAEAYTPQADPVAGVVAPLTLLAGAKAVPAGATAAENAALKFMFPGAKELAGKTTPDLAATGVDMLRKSLDPTAMATLQASRAAGGIGAGTAVNEAGRQASSLAHGEGFAEVSPENVAADVLSNAVFAGPLMKSMGDPYKSMQSRVMQTFREASKLRTQAEAQTYNATRGQRIAATHKSIFDDIEAGRDPSANIATLQATWDEVPTAEHGVQIVKSMTDDANLTGIPDDAFQRIVAGVQGRYTDLFKSDPSLPGPETVNELVRRGFMPRITKEWMAKNWPEAVDQLLGDYEGAKVNLVNRIAAHYEEVLPGALEAMRAAPVEEGLTRKALNTQTSKDKDAQYIQSILNVTPHLKNAKVPDAGVDENGNPKAISLLQAIFKRDEELSASMFDTKGPFSTSNHAKYDAWRDAVMEVAATYDPVTRQGKYQTKVNGPLVPVSFEDMVAMKDGKYTFKPRIKREIERAGMSAAPRDALAFIEERFRPTEQVEEDLKNLSNPEEQFVQARKELVRSPDDIRLTDDETGQLELDADEQGLEGKARADYIAERTDELRSAQAPIFGVDLQATNKEEYYDIALHLMNKVDKATNAELWDKYGGEKVFGKGAKYPGKFQLFKDALLARMESEMDDTGALSVAQKKFYEGWKAVKDAKQQTGEVKKLANTWEEQRAQFRHALRLYWGTNNPLPTSDLILSMLDDKPKYQQMLLAAKAKGAKSLSEPEGNSVEQKLYTQLTGQKSAIADAIRLGRGYGRRLGLDEQAAMQLAETMGKMAMVWDETTSISKLVTPDKTTGGLNFTTPLKSGIQVAINFDQIAANNQQPVAAAIRMLQIAAHEFAHNYSDHAAEYSSIYNRQRVDAYAKLRALFNDLGPEATTELMDEIIPQVLFPQRLQSMSTSSLAGQDFGQEAVSRLMEHVTLGAFMKDNPWQVKGLQKSESWTEATRWLPDEVQAVMNLALRDITNLVGALEDFYKNYSKTTPDRRKAMTYLRPLMMFAQEYLNTNAKELAEARTVVQNMMSKLTIAGSSDWTDPTVVQSTEFLDDKMLRKLASESKMAFSKTDPTDSELAQQLTFGPLKGKLVMEHEKRLGTTVPPWSRFAGLFFQAMRRYQKAGVPLANDAMAFVNDLEPTYFRLTKVMHDPFLAYDKNNRLVYDPNNPVLEMLQKSTPESVKARNALNRLYLWANKNGKPVVLKGPDGKVTVNPEAQTEVTAAIGSMPAEVQQATLEGLSRLIDGYKAAADIAYHSQVEQSAGRLAAIFMTIDRSMYYNEAFKTAKLTTEAGIQLQAATRALKQAQEKEPLLVPQRQQELQHAQANLNGAMIGLQGDQIAAVTQYLMGNEGLAQKLLDLGSFFDKRKDWFGSESRPGNIFIVSRMADGENHYTSAANETEAKRVMKELTAQGHTGFQFIDKNHKDDFTMFQSPDAVVDNFVKLEESAWKTFLHQMRERLSTEDIEYLDSLGYTPGATSEKYIQNKAVDRYMQKRELLPGRERLDAFEVFRDYTGRMSGAVARKGLRQQIDLLLRDPRVRLDGEFKATVKEAMNALMTPIDDRFVAARAGITAYFLGMPNFVGPMVEGTQSASTILPYLVDEAGFERGHKTFFNAVSGFWKYDAVGKDLESKRVLASAQQKEGINPKAMTLEEAKTLYYKRAADEGSFQYGPIYSATFSRDHQMLTQQAFGLGKSTPKTREQLLTDPLYWLAQRSMYLYSKLSAVNGKIAFLGGLETLYNKGFRGQELYSKARAFQSMATYGGGKANSLGFTNKLSNPTTRSSFSLLESLQRYTFGNVTQWKDHIADIIGNTDLSKAERVRAAQALGTATFFQILMAGALGIPGVAIAAGVLKSMTGGKIDAKQKMREGWKDLMNRLGADDELAVTVANYAQNGVTSNMLGVDLSSRVTVNSVLGFNQYNGFSLNDAFGAAGGVIERLIEGTRKAVDGKPIQAAKSFAPPSWSPYFDLGASKYQYGNMGIRDQSNRLLLEMTGPEATAFALGLKPQRLRHIRDQQEAMRTSKTAYDSARDAKLDELSQQLLQGNTQGVLQHIQQLRAQDPTIQPQATASAVIDRAVAASTPQDLLASGSVGNEESQRLIAQSFGNVAPRQSEVQTLLKKEQLNARLGYLGGQPATGKEFERAALIDALVKSRGMTRGEAVRLVQLMGY